MIQEVFAAVAAGLGGFRHDRPGDTFRGWLRGITRNQVLLHFRRNQGRPQAEGGSDALGRLQDLADPLPDPDGGRGAGGQPAVPPGGGAGAWRVRGSHLAHVLAGRDRWPPHRRPWPKSCSVTAAAVRQAKSRVLRRLKQEMGELLE